MSAYQEKYLSVYPGRYTEKKKRLKEMKSLSVEWDGVVE